MAVNPNSNIYKEFSSSTEGPSAIPMPKPKETGSEEGEDLRKKIQSAQSVEEARRAKLEELVKAIKERSVFFSGDSSETKDQEKTKLSLVENFCRQSKQFNDVVAFLEDTADLLRLPEMAKSFAEKLDSILQNPSENPYNITRVRGFNPNEIKLNGNENLVDQLEAEGVKLDVIDKNIKKCTRYLDKDRPHFVLMVLPDGRFLTLDINKYDRDKEQNLNERPPSGPQESIQKQPDLGPIKGILRKSPAPNYSPEKPTENQESGFKENTSTNIPNYLPTPLFGFEPTSQADKKQPVAEGPPLGPQNSNREQPPSGPQNGDPAPYHLPTRLPKDQREGSEKKAPNIADLGNKTPRQGVRWAEKIAEIRTYTRDEPTGR